MPKDNEAPVEVIQGDEEAATAYLNEVEVRLKSGVKVLEVLPCEDGSPHPLALAFAKHRLAYQSEAPAQGELFQRAERAWQRFFYPANDCFDTGPAADKLPFVDLEVADCLRLVLAHCGFKVRHPEERISYAMPEREATLPLADREAIAREVFRRTGCSEKCAGDAADAILALSGSLPPSPVGESIAGVVPLSVGQWLAIEQARFLCDRLDDLDWCDLGRTANDFAGHVDPALSRLKTTLESLAPTPPTPAPVRGE